MQLVDRFPFAALPPDVWKASDLPSFKKTLEASPRLVAEPPKTEKKLIGRSETFRTSEGKPELARLTLRG